MHLLCGDSKRYPHRRRVQPSLHVTASDQKPERLRTLKDCNRSVQSLESLSSVCGRARLDGAGVPEAPSIGCRPRSSTAGLHVFFYATSSFVASSVGLSRHGPDRDSGTILGPGRGVVSLS